VVAGRKAGAKTFIHESNAYPGKANRITARSCDEVLLGFQECAQHFPGRATQVVGTPVRADLETGLGKAEARESFGLDPGSRTLMVMGGSQGARGINRAVDAALPELAAAGVQVLHISGPVDADEVRAAHAGAGPGLRSHVAAFCDDIGRAYAAADLVVARSGASSLAEFASLGLPALLVPYPHAADDHQAKNAAIFKDANAALVLEERHLTGSSLAKAVTDIIADPACLATLARNCRALAVPGAAASIADRIERACAT
jgi:UDP-N-acetylglucosamine--N-acetylmuramyl-(pentapeptide) pyrophosphoryl-undecaprenol N-acetylglucosamine transferase